MSYKFCISTVAAVLVFAVGCSSDPTVGTGRVNVLLTDTPLDLSTVEAVNVTVEDIILFARGQEDDDGNGMEMERPGVATGQGLTLNLLDFQGGETITIATQEVPEGEYQKLRMYVVDAELVSEDPDDPMSEIVEPIAIDSRKVDIPVRFNVTAGENMDVVIDFDASLSVQVNTTEGQKSYILRPVITPTGVYTH